MWNQYKNYHHFLNKNLLAIDYGQKFTGLATYRPGNDPYPLTYGRLAYKSDKTLVQEIIELCSSEDIDIIILGVPKLLDGKETTMTKTIRDFGEKLTKQWKKEFYFQDETLSSFEAKERMKNSAQYNFQIDMNKIDEVAACIILEDFIKTDL